MKPFETILGQDAAVHELQEELQRDRMNHAYLFEGATGTGRLTLARAFASILLYGPDSDHQPDAHADYLELPREAPALRIRRFVERSGSGSGSEEIDHTPVMPFLYLKPLMADRRICVIPDAERMTVESSNTFLKTLEEPPGKAVILMTTSARDRMLKTIVSRCRRVRVCPLSETQIAEALVQKGFADAERSRALALLGEGSLGAAIEFASGESLDHWEWLSAALAEQTPAGALDLAKGLIERSTGSNAQLKRRQATRLLDLMALQIRQRLRDGLNPKAAARIFETLWRAGEQLAANTRLELVLHAAALNTISSLRQA